MIILDANFPDNLWTSDLVNNKLIPCISRISAQFEIEFLPPIFHQSYFATVRAWDASQLQDRVMPLMGGAYLAVNHSQISLKEIDRNVYQIEDLLFFNPEENSGWHPVIKDGNWGPLLSSGDHEREPET